MPSNQPADLQAMLDDAVAPLGFELLGLELNLSGGGGLLRIYIDHPEHAVTVDDCATVSHEISAVLDMHDPIPGNYRLEVSSPGLDRPLFKPSHYQRFVGEKIKLTTSLPIDGRKRFSGKISSANETQVTLEVDGNSVALPFGAVEKARLVPSFDKPAKPGSAKR